MGDTVYERYINTDSLLACQKRPEELVNHDELCFQTTHQVSELWMKEIRHELAEVATLMGQDEADGLWRGVHLLRRVQLLLGFLSSHLSVLETMHPTDYTPIRATLGNGSGMDSPGFRGILATAPAAAAAFAGLLARRGLTPLDLQRQPDRGYGLFQLMQGLLDFDEGFQRFRHSHLMLTRRQIGDAVGLSGVAVAVLEKRARHSFFPDLWQAIAEMSEERKLEYGGGEAP
jgi:tryptophan 2,3-dioxygenase